MDTIQKPKMWAFNLLLGWKWANLSHEPIPKVNSFAGTVFISTPSTLPWTLESSVRILVYIAIFLILNKRLASLRGKSLAIKIRTKIIHHQINPNTLNLEVLNLQIRKLVGSNKVSDTNTCSKWDKICGNVQVVDFSAISVKIIFNLNFRKSLSSSNNVRPLSMNEENLTKKVD